MIKAVLLDRDGVINVDKDYVHSITEFEFKEGIFELLTHLANRGYAFFIVTNQSGIARGYYTEEQYAELTEWMLERFEEQGITISKVYHCPHGPKTDCDCRKPNAGMLLSAVEEYNIDVTQSWMIGDKERDIEAGINAGIHQNILITGKKGENPNETKADYVVDHLQEIQSIIKE